MRERLKDCIRKLSRDETRVSDVNIVVAAKGVICIAEEIVSHAGNRGEDCSEVRKIE